MQWLTRILSKFYEHSIKQTWSLNNLVFTKINFNAAAENKDDDSDFIKDYMWNRTPGQGQLFKQTVGEIAKSSMQASLLDMLKISSTEME